MLKRSGMLPIQLLRKLTTNVLPAMVATYVPHHIVNEWMSTGPRFKRRGHEVHHLIISCATQITPGNCPLRDENPPGPSELLSATLAFKLETALPQAHSFTHVACPIHSAPILTKSNTACPPPSALILPKSILLDCNSCRQTHIVSVGLNIPWI